MITKKIFRYLGRNGTITTPIILENIAPIPMVNLIAEKGKILTDGHRKTYQVNIFEDEVNNWYEIDDDKEKGQN